MITFGPFRVAKARRLLERDGQPVQIGSRAFDILAHLLERRGQVVSHSELLATVWLGTIVDEGSLRFQMTTLRKALGAGESNYDYITNVPGRGYCFTAQISRREEAESSPVMAGIPIRPPNPPPRPSRLIGRESAIREITELLISHRIVTILGAGGMGKTSVATAVAQDCASMFPDGICFLELGLVNDEDQVTDALAVALGLCVRSTEPLIDITNFLNSKTILILIDGCEHLINSSARLIEQIALAADGARVLSTSREALRADGERLYHLASLSLPPAVGPLTAHDILGYPAPQLFLERIRAAGNALEEKKDAELIGAICTKLDGLPLAIELAASQALLIGVDRVAALLEKSLALEWRGRRTAPPRHQTLGAMLDWSYNLLSEEEQKALRYVSVFGGKFDLDGVKFVIDGEIDNYAAHLVSQLVSKSLLCVDRSRNGTRYHLLDTTKTYARRKLTETGEAESLRYRHASYYLQALSATGDQDHKNVEAFASEIDDITSAIVWAFSSERGLKLAVPLVVATIPIWNLLHLYQDERLWILRAIAFLQQSDPGKQMELTLQEGLAWAIHFTNGFSEDYHETLSKVLSIAEDQKETDKKFVALLNLWGAQIRQTNIREALETGALFKSLVKSEKDSPWTGMGEWRMGVVKFYSGEYVEAQALLERAACECRPQAIELQQRYFYYDCRTVASAYLATISLISGDAHAAVTTSDRGLKQAIADQTQLAIFTIQSWATINFMLMGHIEAASQIATDFFDESRRRGDARFFSIAKTYMALIGLARGDDGRLTELDDCLVELKQQKYGNYAQFFEAERLRLLLEQGRNDLDTEIMPLNTTDANAGTWYFPEAIRLNGCLAFHRDQVGEAEKHFLAALQAAKRQGSIFWELRTANDLAQIWIADGRKAQARSLLKNISSKMPRTVVTRDLDRAASILDGL